MILKRCFLPLFLLASLFSEERPLSEEILKAGQLAEIQFNREASDVFASLPRHFPETSKNGYWEFRAKTRRSCADKFLRFIETGKAKTIEEAKALIFDGIGARLALDQPNAEVMNTFTEELATLLHEGKVKLIQIENYHADESVPYLSPENIRRLRSASPTQFNVLTGDKAVKEDGYTSLHMDLEVSAGPRFELQVRGVFTQQLSNISHFFYEAKQDKPVPRHYRKNRVVQTVREQFKKLNDEQLSDYDKYLAQGFEFVRSYVNGFKHDRAPQLPESLSAYPSLKLEQVAHAMKYFRLRSLYEDPGDFSERRKHLFFDSLRHLLTTQTEPVIDSIVGNVVQAGLRRERAIDIQYDRRQLLEETDGLNYVDVIVWTESPYYKYRRRKIRSGEGWPEKVLLPKYDKNQRLGLQKVPLHEIHYMQDSADNETGDYTVIDNAIAIREGKLDPDKVFVPIQVWRDTTGKVWALDHRRLAALELAGTVKKVEVEFVPKTAVKADRFKFTNASDGRSIIISIEKSPLAIVISKETSAKFRKPV